MSEKCLPTDAERRMLAGRCRSRRTRTSDFTPQAPTEWQPATLRNPLRPREYFTDDGAWSYIADSIESGCAIEIVVLALPPGKRGFVLKLKACPPIEAIYVKLQLGAKVVIGRSFHVDKPKPPRGGDHGHE